MQFAVLLQRVRGFGPVIRTESRGVELNLTTCVPRLSVEAPAVARRACEQLHAAGIEMFRQQNCHGRRTVGVVVVVERDLPRERQDRNVRRCVQGVCERRVNREDILSPTAVAVACLRDCRRSRVGCC